MTRFVADVHLGKLARHLRMLGFDTLWRDDFEDDRLLEVAASEHRVLLTRDRELSQRAGAMGYFVNATDPGHQIVEVVDRFGLRERVTSGAGFLSLCLQCNSPLVPAKPHQVVDRVPGHLLLEQDEFFLCPRCERVYWKGSHFDRMRDWVRSRF